MKLRIYTTKALAHKLGVTHDYARQILVKFQRGELKSWKGYKFFGERKKAWFAYPETIELELIDATDETDRHG